MRRLCIGIEKAGVFAAFGRPIMFDPDREFISLAVQFPPGVPGDGQGPLDRYLVETRTQSVFGGSANEPAIEVTDIDGAFANTPSYRSWVEVFA